jgi:hypothetical protein
LYIPGPVFHILEFFAVSRYVFRDDTLKVDVNVTKSNCAIYNKKRAKYKVRIPKPTLDNFKILILSYIDV